MLKRALFLMFLLASFGIHAQSFKEFMSEGERQYGRKKYKEAIIAYKKAMEINPDDAMLNFKLGLAYLYSDTKSKAATFIDKAYKLNPNIDNRIDYHLGIAFQNRNDFKRAIEHFQYFSKSNPHVAEIADKKIAECLKADSIVQYELNVEIKNLGSVVNSALDEYSPIISADGNTLIFTSNRGEPTKAGRHEDIYTAFRAGDSWSEPKKLGSSINTEYNDAAASLSPDGKTMFLYYEINGGDIYTSTLNGTEWSKPVPLNGNINTSQYWETCASVSPDGKKLYFASNKPGGFGELDIYVSELDSKGNWGKGVNLGPSVNTSKNDDSPYIHYDGVTLYFSSDGHPNIGNSDIFVTEFKNGKWTKPENLGYPVNSWEFDGFFSISPDKKTAYYATVKEGDNGGVDIYSVKFLEPKYKPKPKPVEVVTNTVATKESSLKTSNSTTAPSSTTTSPTSNTNSTGTASNVAVASNAKLADYIDPLIEQVKATKVYTILRGKVIDETDAHPLEASISLVDNETGKLISRITSNSVSGDFEIIIPHGGNYGVATERQGYLFNSINFSLPKFAEFQEVDTHIIMTPAEIGSKVVLKNIFFDVGKSDIKSISIAELEKIVELLRSNSSLKVQINGHTDNTGNAATNKTLSLKRATSVVEYLINKGINASRVAAKGYGAERPIVSNDDEDGGREINRRTEIEIVGAG